MEGETGKTVRRAERERREKRECGTRAARARLQSGGKEGAGENYKLHEKCKMQPQRQLLGKPQAQNGHAHAHKRPVFLLASSATTSRQFLANCF